MQPNYQKILAVARLSKSRGTKAYEFALIIGDRYQGLRAELLI
jgi:hypothetical protein